jgi:hypothetical protein
MRDTNGSEREVTGGRKTFHSEGLYDLCSLPNITKEIEARRMMSWHALVARMGEKSRAY